MKPIIGHPEFLQKLDNWLFKNTQEDAKWIASKKSAGIPPVFRSYNDWLYRGMFVDAGFLLDLEKGKVKLNTYTSWTKDERIAIKFAKDKTASGGMARGNVAIVLKKKIGTMDQVFDIDGFCLYMGADQLVMLGMDDLSVDSAIKEKEVLIESGLQINKTDVKYL